MSETRLISVRVSKEVAKRLATLADATARSKSYVAAQAIEEFLSLQEWQVKAIRKGSAEAEAGKLLYSIYLLKKQYCSILPPANHLHPDLIFVIPQKKEQKIYTDNFNKTVKTGFLIIIFL